MLPAQSASHTTQPHVFRLSGINCFPAQFPIIPPNSNFSLGGLASSTHYYSGSAFLCVFELFLTELSNDSNHTEPRGVEDPLMRIPNIKRYRFDTAF